MDNPKPPSGEPKEPVPIGRCGSSICAEACVATCKTCCDSQWLIPGWQIGLGHDAPERRPVACPDCEFRGSREHLQRQRKSMLAAIGFTNSREPLGTLENYNPDLQPRGEGRNQCRRALQAVKRWCLDEGTHLLLLIGGTGIGKSHLAEAAVEYLAFTRKKQAFLMAGEDFAFELASYLSTNDVNRRAYEVRMRSVDFLVLDEVGIAYGKGDTRNPYVASLYQRIIGYRYNNGLPTLVTGNIADDQDLKDVLGDRVHSRLQDSKHARTIDMWQAQSMRVGAA